METNKIIIESLLNGAVGIAEEILEKHERFSTFAVWIDKNEELKMGAGYDIDKNNLVGGLEKRFLKETNNGNMKAAAIVTNCTFLINRKNKEMQDTIHVTMYDKDKITTIKYPYTRQGSKIKISEAIIMDKRNISNELWKNRFLFLIQFIAIAIVMGSILYFLKIRR